MVVAFIVLMAAWGWVTHEVVYSLPRWAVQLGLAGGAVLVFWTVVLPLLRALWQKKRQRRLISPDSRSA
jgi:hypothetical protein